MSLIVPEIYIPGESSPLCQDFIGFRYNGIHSSQLGIMRSNDGNRFTENLLPSISDQSEQIPNGNGTYYFGSFFADNQCPINITFDNMTEYQFRAMRQLFGDQKLHDLIFDERPYKAYKAKLSQSPVYKYVCFEKNGQRIYKGDASLNFKSFDPFARSTFKYISNCPEYITNIDEWEYNNNVPFLPLTQGNYDTYDSDTHTFLLTNRGDIPTTFILELPLYINNVKTKQDFFISLSQDNEIKGTLVLSSVLAKNGDTHIQINTKLHLIEGYNNGIKTGTIYNETINYGDFFEIPLGDSILTVTSQNIQGSLLPINPTIDYKYLYY